MREARPLYFVFKERRDWLKAGKKIMKKLIGGIMVAVVCSISAIGAESVPVVKTMPPDGRKDVKIHFYIDGHRRNKDANMRKDTSRAYIRAINALRGVLTDRNNPIDDGLRQRGIGKNVEVNVGNAFLLMPDRIAPFSLSKQASESDFGKFGPEESAWDRDVLVKKILENEKNSENIVVCVISNDPNLSTKHGSFYLEGEKGIMFFMLHAPRESVNAGFFQPYWSVEEWASFLRESMGVNANDIANVIVDSYYALSRAEEDGLKAVVSTPTDESITVKKIRSMPQKKMWKSAITHNGVVISNEEDALTLAPKSGQNKVVAQILSPTGVSYARTWEQDSFSYRALNDDGQLYSKAREMLAKAKVEGVTTPEIRAIERLVLDPKKPILKAKLEGLNKTVDAAQAEVVRVRKVREVKNVIKEVASGVKEIGTLADDDALAPQVKKIVERLSEINKGLKEDIQLKVVENLKKEADELKAELAKIEKAIAERDMEKGRSLLLAKIEAKRTQAQSAENKEKKCNNLANLDGFADEANKASTVAAIKRIGDEVDQWAPQFATLPVAICQTNSVANQKKVDKPLDEKIVNIEPFRVELKAKVQAMLDDPDNAEDEIENREDLNKFMGQLNQAKSKPELEEIKSDIEDWERLPVEVETDGGFGVLGLVFILIVIGAIAFVVKKLLSGKTVATISFQKTGSTDAAVKAEVKLNKPLRFDESLDCEVDIRATPRRNEAGGLEFELISPNKTVWLLKLGNDKKKQINEIPVLVEEGVYQIFDNEIAMQPMGKAEFESIEAM